MADDSLHDPDFSAGKESNESSVTDLEDECDIAEPVGKWSMEKVKTPRNILIGQQGHARTAVNLRFG